MPTKDGLPLFKTSTKCFWPILTKINEKGDATPFVIGVFCGNGKPSTLGEYLKDSISNLSCFLENGLDFKGKYIPVQLRGFTCDAPAHSFLKCIVGHTDFGCEKCVTKGEWISERVVFLDCKAQLRTDSSFKNMEHKKHHSKDFPSPLTQLNIGMVSNFPLDYMHLICLGVM